MSRDVIAVVRFMSVKHMSIDRAALREYILANVTKDEETGCWLWIKGLSGDGYAQGVMASKPVRANRISYLAFVGEIPKGRFVCHDCPGGDNPKCVNYKHLWLGTPKENSRDMILKGRSNFGQKNHGSKLTELQVEEMREMFDTGIVDKKTLSAYYDISIQQVRKILRYEAW